MEKKNCDLLFEYLRSILYDPEIKPLDLDSLDEPYRRLGLGMQFLAKSVCEMMEYSEALSKGKLSVSVPPRDNFLCKNLKNIHANLNHLTWQAKQAAKGDYSQSVSYLGEFSEAFNSMTKQLRERELSLKQEAALEKEHADILENYNHLLTELISRSDEEILVTDMEEQTVLYSNENPAIHISIPDIYDLFLKQLEKESIHRHTQQDTYEWTWEAEDSRHHFYKITTGFIEWQGRKAYLHLIREVTEEKTLQARLEAKAYLDPLTGIGNRHFFQTKLDEFLANGQRIVLCYCDLDHLKYVNDTYGHSEGDWYIQNFADTVLKNIRCRDIFARIGGDEFCIILKKCPRDEAEEKLKSILDLFGSDTSKPYPKGFSYGITEIPKDHAPLTAEAVLHQADMNMYHQKQKHKNQYRLVLNSAADFSDCYLQYCPPAERI